MQMTGPAGALGPWQWNAIERGGGPASWAGGAPASAGALPDEEEELEELDELVVGAPEELVVSAPEELEELEELEEGAPGVAALPELELESTTSG